MPLSYLPLCFHEQKHAMIPLVLLKERQKKENKIIKKGKNVVVEDANIECLK